MVLHPAALALGLAGHVHRVPEVALGSHRDEVADEPLGFVDVRAVLVPRHPPQRGVQVRVIAQVVPGLDPGLPRGHQAGVRIEAMGVGEPVHAREAVVRERGGDRLGDAQRRDAVRHRHAVPEHEVVDRHCNLDGTLR